MSLQGKTTIEITNTKTGEKKVVEHKNRVTKAAAEILKPFGLYSGSGLLYASSKDEYKSLVELLFGSLILLDTTVGSDENAVHIPPGASVIGTAGYKIANTGTGSILGSYNSVESEIDYENGTIKFVYDFNTNQGNGTIKSVCLSQRNGYLGALFETGSHGTQRLEYKYYADTLGGDIMCTYYKFAEPLSFFPWIMEIDEDNDEIIQCFLSVRSADVEDDLPSFIFQKYPGFLKSFDPFLNRYNGAVKIKSIEYIKSQHPVLRTGSNDTYIFKNFDFENRTMYFVNTPAVTVPSEGTFQIYAINVDTKQETFYSLTNKTGITLGSSSYEFAHINVSGTLSWTHYSYPFLNFFVYDGYIYCRNGGILVKININDSDDFVNIQNDTSESVLYAHDAYGGRIYSYCDTSSLNQGYCYGTVLDTDKNMVYNWPISHYRPGRFMLFPIKGRNVVQLSTKTTTASSNIEDGLTLVVRPNYLATVNDLSTPITKTSEDTMKITYTLSRADDDETT